MKRKYLKRLLALLLCAVLVLPMLISGVSADDAQEPHVHTEDCEHEETPPAPVEEPTEVPNSPVEEPTEAPSSPVDAEDPTDAPVALIMEAPGPKAAAPEITVNGDLNSSGFYCYAPTVTVTGATTITLTVDGQVTTISSNGGLEDLTSHLPQKAEDMSFPKVSIKAEGVGGTATAEFRMGHSKGEVETKIIPPTCTKNGEEQLIFHCADCADGIYMIVTYITKALGHTYITGEVCGSTGEISYCSVCGCREDGNGYVGGNGNHEWKKVEKAATCTEDGYSYDQCSKCGAVKDRTDTSKLGHTWSEWKTESEGDCSKSGSKTIKRRSCTRCNAHEDWEVPPTHTYEGPRSLTKAECDRYNRDNPNANLKPATCTEGGAYGKVCTNCGTVIDVNPSGPALGHTYANDDFDCTTAEVCTVCGAARAAQASHTLIWVANETGTGHSAYCTNKGCKYQSEQEEHVYPKNYLCNRLDYCELCGHTLGGYKGHNYATDYASDGTYHYRPCQNPHCTSSIDKEKHTTNNDHDCTTADTCKVCGLTVREAEPSHNLTIKSNSAGHNYKCTNSGCGYTTTFEDHVYTAEHLAHFNCQEPIYCSICGWKGNAPAKEHKLADGYEYDATGHWKRCTNKEVLGGSPTQCTYTTPVTPHTITPGTCVAKAYCAVCGWVGEIDPDNHVNTQLRDQKPATETEDGYTGDLYCNDCGKKLKEGTVIPKLTAPCDHDYKLANDAGNCWMECTKCHDIQDQQAHDLAQASSAEGHYEECARCHYKTPLEAHTPDQDDGNCLTEKKCTKCDYVLEEKKPSHNFGGAYFSSPDGHWRQCQNEGCTSIDLVKPHTPGEDDGDCTTAVLCTVCGYPTTPAQTHVPTGEWVIGPTTHYYNCQNDGCTQRVDEAPHHYVNGVCTVCGAVGSLPPLPDIPTPTHPSTSPTTKPDSTEPSGPAQTGDSTPVLSLLALLALSGAAIPLLLAKTKRKK